LYFLLRVAQLSVSEARWTKS